MSEQDGLLERVRSTYQAVTVSTASGPPPPLTDVHRKRTVRLPMLRVAGALVLVLATAVGVAVLTNTGTPQHAPKQLPPVDEEPLFPDVVPHQGPDLLLVPGFVPDGYHLLYATGPDPTRPGTSSGGSVNSTFQTWVKLDAAGIRPLAGFTLSWGPQDLAESGPPGAGPAIRHQDALTAYGKAAEPITVNGHRGVWAEYLETVAWEQDGKAIAISADQDNWTGTWSEHLTRTELETMASTVVRLADGSYQLAAAPPGFHLAATSLGFTSQGSNERRLVYTDGNGQGFAIQLVDNTQVPPGVALGLGGAGARLVEVRGQRAVQTHFLNGGDGAGCANIDEFLCANNKPGTLNNAYVQWLEPDTTRVTLTGVGITDDQLLEISERLRETTTQEWTTFTNSTNGIPCALTARCPSG